MEITPLSPQNQAAVLAYLRRAPYRNALPLSNASQLRARCDVLVAETEGMVRGVASTYRDLPIPNLTFATESIVVMSDLLAALAGRNPALREATAWALLPEDRYHQLARLATVEGYEIEYQMVVEPETLRAPDGPETRRLTADDLPALNELAAAAGLTVWHERALELGPAFGCFADGRLMAMAGTHFATPEIVEIGHIATHPEARRRGYASACTAALTRAAFVLAPRVFLMVLDHNTAALAAYKRLGFRAVDRFHLTRFRLQRPS
ncbi:MAG TPA: GNAT family N-acetyltransferase [Roseiflexaceae bacterium]|nr:GNAT family N-acetyltransferase [Roseiflexaceae bacterium]